VLPTGDRLVKEREGALVSIVTVSGAEEASGLPSRFKAVATILCAPSVRGVAVICLGLLLVVSPTNFPSAYSRTFPTCSGEPVKKSTANVGVLSLIILSVLLAPLSLDDSKSRPIVSRGGSRYWGSERFLKWGDKKATITAEGQFNKLLESLSASDGIHWEPISNSFAPPNGKTGKFSPVFGSM
jgi:hypothetical protein